MQAIERQTMYGQQEGYYHNFFFLYTTKYVVKKKTYLRNWEEDHELKSN